MNPNQSIYDDPRLQQARSAYEGASKAATESESASFNLPNQLKQALVQKFSQNNPLIQARESALKNYLNETTAAPLSVTAQSAGGSAPVVYNPLQQADLIQRRRSVPTSQLATANELLDLATGSMSDIINSTSRAQQADTARLQGKAKIAGENYTTILDELSKKAEEAFRERQFQESIRQFDVSQLNHGGGGTASERAESSARSALQRDVERGVTFKELYVRYGSDLPEYEIREVYNEGPTAKKYGPAKETSADLIKSLSEIKKTKPIDKETINVQKGIFNQLDRLTANYSNLSIQDKLLSLIPGSSRFNVDIGKYNSAKNLISIDLAKLRQKGVLSDQDIRDAMALFPPPLSSKEAATEQIRQVKEYIEERISINTGQQVIKNNKKDPLKLF